MDVGGQCRALGGEVGVGLGGRAGDQHLSNRVIGLRHTLPEVSRLVALS